MWRPADCVSLTPISQTAAATAENFSPIQIDVLDRCQRGGGREIGRLGAVIATVNIHLKSLSLSLGRLVKIKF